MSEYLAYHRKYRPKKLSEYIGNPKVKKGVIAALEGASKPQVILMQGQAGGGKTSMARLLAKEYLCENRHPITGACGSCYNCQTIEDYIETGNQGGLSDVMEVDVTDSSGKKDIDALLDEVNIPSFTGNWKVFILDEVHELSKAGQSRLLKTLEEPAERVLIILCTTDPQKLLDTIISRCQYNFIVTKPSREDLVGLLVKVCKAEGIRHDIKALSLVCVKGDFVPRKTLVELEKVVREKKDVTYENTVEALDLVSDKYFFDFYKILLKEVVDIYEYITFIGKVKSDMDIKQFVDNLVSFTVRGLYIFNGVNAEALDKSEVKQYSRIFSQVRAGDVAHLLNALLDMKNSLDMETKLLLLGYTGLRRNKPQHDSLDIQLLNIEEETASKEKMAGDENHIKSMTMTEEEKQKFVEDNTKEVKSTDLASLFGGSIIQTPE